MFNLNELKSQLAAAQTESTNTSANYADTIAAIKAKDNVLCTTATIVSCSYNPANSSDYYRLTLSAPAVRLTTESRVANANGTYTTTYKPVAATQIYLHRAVVARYFGGIEAEGLAVAAMSDPQAISMLLQGKEIEIVQEFINGNTEVVNPFTGEKYTPKSDTINDYIGSIDLGDDFANSIATAKAKAKADATARLATYLAL